MGVSLHGIAELTCPGSGSSLDPQCLPSPEPGRHPVNYCWASERVAKDTCAFVEPRGTFSGWPRSRSVGKQVVCRMVCDILLHKARFSLESSFLCPVPGSEMGCWQSWLRWTSARPWAMVAWHGAVGALGLPKSCPSLGQDRRSKVTQSCFHVPCEWASPLLAFPLKPGSSWF